MIYKQWNRILFLLKLTSININNKQNTPQPFFEKTTFYMRCDNIMCDPQKEKEFTVKTKMVNKLIHKKKGENESRK